MENRKGLETIKILIKIIQSIGNEVISGEQLRELLRTSIFQAQAHLDDNKTPIYYDSLEIGAAILLKNINRVISEEGILNTETSTQPIPPATQSTTPPLPTPANERALIPRVEVMAKYKITAKTFSNWEARGLKVLRVGGKVFVDSVDLEKFENKRK
tara:strand:+ start:5365 stop:5835 length:471 start_codon:yes stop_codon:yes gene_type:complete